MQRALLQYKKPENADLVRKALTKCGRTDLIGFGKECLVRPAGAAHHEHPRNNTKTQPSRTHNTSSEQGGAGSRKSSAPSKKGWAKAKPKPTGTKKKKK